MRLVLATTAALAIALPMAAAPAQASTLPALDRGPGRVDLAIGLLDLGLDVAVHDRVKVGATVFFPPVVIVGIAGAAGRVTARLTPDAWPVALGLMVSVGGLATSGATSSGTAVWAQPALIAAWAPGDDAGLALRASVGPVAGWTTSTTRGPRTATNASGDVVATKFEVTQLLPNFELAYRFSPHHELTVGGNALIGWRGRF